MKKALTIVFGSIMILAGVVHFLRPHLYTPFFPEYFPRVAIVYVSGLAEIMAGLCALLPRYRSFGTLAILLMMIAFLPLHIIDVFKDKPVIGTRLAAGIRLPLQFVLIAWAWYIHTKQLDDRQMG